MHVTLSMHLSTLPSLSVTIPITIYSILIFVYSPTLMLVLFPLIIIYFLIASINLPTFKIPFNPEITIPSSQYYLLLTTTIFYQ